MNFTALLTLLLPIIGASAFLLMGKIKEKFRNYFVISISLTTFFSALSLIPQVLKGPIHFNLTELFGLKTMVLSLNIDFLGLFMLCLISLLGVLVTLYSLTYMKKYKGLSRYYFLLLLFIGAMNGTVIAGDLITFFIFWEIMTVSSFLLVIFDGTEEARKAGIKFFIMTASGSLFMLFSIASVYMLTGTVSIPELINQGIETNSVFTQIILLLFLIGLGVKAGMVPLHTWLPDAHPAAPSPISSLLSGIMIKMGIYMMLRIFCQIFSISISWNLIISFLGVLTILLGVMLALIQHDAKRLLAFHSVSQIGYMILGIGVGTTLGIAGALFHLVNHAFFKGLLFLCIGVVIYRIGERNLDKLGGLSRIMPVTFVSCLIASLSISGVPPFNGFVSKWIIYQALLEKGSSMYIVFLVAAMFGSALTLASFMKLIHATFLGQKSLEFRELSLEKENHSTLNTQHSIVKEVHWAMWFPMVVLAGLCIIFGVFAFQIPLKYFISPILSTLNSQLSTVFIGFFNPTLAGGLILLGLILGVVVYLLGNIKTVRTEEVFIGGERLDEETMRISGVNFYDTIKLMNPFHYIYKKEEENKLDIYPVAMKKIESSSQFVFKYIEQSIDKFYSIIGKIGTSFIELLRSAHSGILSTYIFWCLAGLLILLFLLMR